MRQQPGSCQHPLISAMVKDHLGDLISALWTSSHLLTMSSNPTSCSSNCLSNSDNFLEISANSTSSSCCKIDLESLIGIGSAFVSDFLARFGRRRLATVLAADGFVEIASSDDPEDEDRTRDRICCCTLTISGSIAIWPSSDVINPCSVWFKGLIETETPESGLDDVIKLRVSTWNPTSRSNGRLST